MSFLDFGLHLPGAEGKGHLQFHFKKYYSVRPRSENILTDTRYAKERRVPEEKTAGWQPCQGGFVQEKKE